MTLLEAISGTSRELLGRDKMIGEIINLDPNPPEGMNRATYRAWLESIATDDLADWHRLITKCHASEI